MHYKIRMGIAIVMMGISALILCAAVAVTYEDKTIRQKERAAEPTIVQGIVYEEPLFILRAQDGKVVVFRSDEQETLFLKTDIHVSGLREYDKKLLQNGIQVNSYEEVIGLLEDFGM